MKKIRYSFVLLLFTLLAFSLSAQNANEVVREMIAILEKTAVSAQYTLSVQEQGTNFPQIYRGNFLMFGDKFRLQADGLDARYDGKTQYIYMEQMDELSISEPTDEELLQVNPILMAKTMFVTCDMRFIQTSNSAAIYHVEFIPKEKESEVELLTLKIRKSDKMLTQVTLVSSQGIVSELGLTQQKTSVSTHDVDFVIGENDYPGAFVNDLR